MESGTDKKIRKQILKDIKFKETSEYKDGKEKIWHYEFSRAIRSYKSEELFEKPTSELINSIAEKIVVKIKDNWGSESVLTEQQINFYFDCSKLILGDSKTNKPVLVPVKCGFGKSTFIKAYISTIIQAVRDGLLPESYMRMIIATNEIKDLSNLQKDIEKEFGAYDECYITGWEGINEPDIKIPYVYYLEGWSKSIKCQKDIRSYSESLEYCNENNCGDYFSCKLGRQMDEQVNSPILAISNQRLAYMLNYDDANEGINKLRKYNSKHEGEQWRNILLIDEKPKIINPKIVTIGSILRVMSKVDERYANTDEEKADKQLMFNELKEIHGFLDNIRQEFKEQKYSYFVSYHNSLSKEFIETWIKHFKTANIGQLNDLNDILINGGLYVNLTEKNYFYTITKNRFNIANMKTFVFDGTAELSLEYDGENSFIFLDVDDYKDFNNLTFNIINENYSKSSIIDNPSKLEPVAKWINNNFKKDMFIISHKKCQKNRDEIIQVNQKLTNLLRDNAYVIKTVDSLGNHIVPYFGITKGKNDWSNCEVMVQIGWNRYREDVYISEYLAANEQIKQKISEEYEKIKFKQTEIIFGNDYGQFKLPDLELFRLLKMAVDLEQEVYRTKIRNFGDINSPVNVYLFGASDTLREIIGQRFKGCHIRNLSNISEFQEFKKLSRKDNEHVKRLIDWIDNDFLINGNIITGRKQMKSTDIKRRLNITDRQWQYLFNEDKDFKEMLKRRRLTQTKERGVNYLKKY